MEKKDDSVYSEGREALGHHHPDYTTMPHRRGWLPPVSQRSLPWGALGQSWHKTRSLGLRQWVDWMKHLSEHLDDTRSLLKEKKGGLREQSCPPGVLFFFPSCYSTKYIDFFQGRSSVPKSHTCLVICKPSSPSICTQYCHLYTLSVSAGCFTYIQTYS